MVLPELAMVGRVNPAHEQRREAGVECKFLEERLGGAKVRFGPLDLELDESAQPLVLRAGEQLFLRYPEPAQLLTRYVNAVTRQIIADVPRDVGELERSREVPAMNEGRRSLVAEDRERDIGDRRRHEIAVVQQVLERLIARLRDVLPARSEERRVG